HPTQIQNHIEQLYVNTHQIAKKHWKLARFLLTHHRASSHHEQTLTYHYHQLQKGLICNKCHSFLLDLCKGRSLCQNCHYESSLESTILKNIQDVTILFPNEKITTNLIHDWCKGVR